MDFQEHWLRGHQSLFERLRREVDWREQSRWMYDREVKVPRLVGALPRDGSSGETGSSLLDEMSGCVSQRYGRELASISFAYYRDGSDSVAMHGDRLGDAVGDAVVCVLSLGSPRRFLMKRVRPESVAGRVASHGGMASLQGEGSKSSASPEPASSLAFNLGWGDLVVMGGTCQATWVHGVPKVKRANPRISVMFREG